MAPTAVMEALNVLEDRAGELDAGGPAPTVEQLQKLNGLGLELP